MHGLDPGGTVDPAVVVAVSGAGAFVGDKIAKGLSIRRQLRHLRARAELIEDGRVRAFVLERLKSTEADWRAGVLSDIAIREVVIDEISSAMLPRPPLSRLENKPRSAKLARCRCQVTSNRSSRHSVPRRSPSLRQALLSCAWEILSITKSCLASYPPVFGFAAGLASKGCRRSPTL